MFTPPPSPLPLPRIVVTDSDSPDSSRTEEENVFETSLSRKLPSSLTSDPNEKRMQEAQAVAVEAFIHGYERKRRTARRMRWAVLLVPAVLILVALTSRRIALLDDALDDISLALGSRNEGIGLVDESGAMSDMVVELTEGGSTTATPSPSLSRHDQTHHHKRQTLSLTNPAAPSSTVLISSISSLAPSDSASTSQAGSPTTTVPQTEQTIPPVPDSSNPPVLPTPFPQPFETSGPESNLTMQTCANFFTNMTQQPAFRSCRPFSLLEQFSDEFIEVCDLSTKFSSFSYFSRLRYIIHHFPSSHKPT